MPTFKKFSEAIDFLESQRAFVAPETYDSHLRKAYALLTFSLNRLGDRTADMRTCEDALKLFPNDLELRFRKGIIYHEAGRQQDAVSTYQDIIANPEPRALFRGRQFGSWYGRIQAAART